MFMNDDIDSLYGKSPELFPKTIAIAMDGNRRWTKKHGLKEIEGHRVSIENMKAAISRAGELGVKSITFWVFSTENFRRDKEFLDAIFTLAREYLESGKYFSEIESRGGKIGIIGDVSLFPKDIAEKVMEYVRKSNPKEHKIDVNFAFGYGGRDEILRAVRKMIQDDISKTEVTEQKFSQYLDLKENIDLLIRTGGRTRTSGLLPWQATYAELYFTETLCPDFNVKEFEKAVLYFTSCVRNFGR